MCSVSAMSLLSARPSRARCRRSPEKLVPAGAITSNCQPLVLPGLVPDGKSVVLVVAK